MTTTRRACLTLAASAVVALAACTGGPANPGSSPDAVGLAEPSDTPTIVPDGSPSAVSVAVSQSLVASSPVVVLAETSTAKQALDAATELGVPLLMVDESSTTTTGTQTAESASEAPSSPEDGDSSPSEGDDTPTVTESATAASASSPTDSADQDAVADEVERLGAETVVALGPAAEAEANTLDGVDVVTDTGGAGKVTKAEPATTTVLFTTTPLPADDAEQVDAEVVASTATGKAIGATVLSTPAGDPRQTEESVTTLSKSKPSQIVAVGSAFGSPDAVAYKVAAASTGVQLPGGGQLISPGKLYIALYGHPGTPSLGLLGEQDLDKAVERTKSYAEQYTAETSSTVIPTFEIITTVATNGAGPDGNYSYEVDPEVFRPWIERAQQEGIYVILDLQPGNDDTLNQAKRYESLLKYPNVGLAIDPEWKLKPGQRHLAQIGQIEVAEANSVIDWLAELTKENKLPQKALVLHQFQTRMIIDRDQVHTQHPELQLIVHVDGHGTPGAKQDTYNVLTRDAPPGLEWGWKNFIDEDSPTFTPKQTMQVTPTPTMVSYQ